MQAVRADDQPISFTCLKSAKNPALIFWSGEGNLLKKKEKKKTQLMSEKQNIF